MLSFLPFTLLGVNRSVWDEQPATLAWALLPPKLSYPPGFVLPSGSDCLGSVAVR